MYSSILCAVAVWIIALPIPGVTASILNRQFRSPAQLCLCQARISVARGDIARPTRRDLIQNVPARRCFKRFYQLQHRRPAASTDVIHLIFIRLAQTFQRRHMRPRQINHVNIIAHVRAVRRVIIVAKHTQNGRACRPPLAIRTAANYSECLTGLRRCGHSDEHQQD